MFQIMVIIFPILFISISLLSTYYSADNYYQHEQKLTLWIKNGDDNNSPSVQIKVPSNRTVSYLKEAILMHPILGKQYDSADKFNIFCSCAKLHDHRVISLEYKFRTFECRLNIPEIYKIRRLRMRHTLKYVPVHQCILGL